MIRKYMSFEESLRHHQTKVDRNDIGEKEMRRWRREKDFSDILNEDSITFDEDVQSIVNNIYDSDLNG